MTDEERIHDISVKLVDAAVQHSEDTQEEHWKGDMEEALGVALTLLPRTSLELFLNHPTIQKQLNGDY